MRTPVRYLWQGVLYLLFAATVGYFSDTPAYTYVEAGKAVIKLSLSHAGKRLVECRRRTAEELAELPPNMRKAMDCPRRRWPVTVEMELDGAAIYRRRAAPAGLAGDGESSFYRTFTVEAGRHRLVLRMKDHGEGGGFDYGWEKEVDLAPAQVLVVGFDKLDKRFVIR